MSRWLRRFLPDSIAGRTILVLLVGLTLSHLLSMGVYHNDLLHELGLSTSRQLAERIVAVKRTLSEMPLVDRDRTAHALSIPGLEVHWAEEPAIDVGGRSEPESVSLRTRIRELAPDLEDGQLWIVFPDQIEGADGRNILAAAQLSDGTWANLKLTGFGRRPSNSLHLLLSTTLMALAILGLAILSVRILTQPLRSLARAAERLGLDVDAPPLSEAGPREIRRAARAFNEMQDRIRKLVKDRTHMLAAISHDLRTPITRLRLRAEFIDDPEQRAKMDADLDEMETMIASTLAFLREESTVEELKVVNLAAMLETICDDATDAGRQALYSGVAFATLRCRPVSLKRAFTNVVENAITYGGRAWVTLSVTDADLLVEIHDDGPGIDPAERARVFDPFYRIETSRNRETGGTGLGLTVARSIIRAHGGDIDLASRPEGGLRVVVILPKPSHA